jgi:hypothetical protein
VSHNFLPKLKRCNDEIEFVDRLNCQAPPIAIHVFNPVVCVRQESLCKGDVM